MSYEDQYYKESPGNRQLPAISLNVYEPLKTNTDQINATIIFPRRRSILYSKIVLTIAAVVVLMVATAVITTIVLKKSNNKNTGELNTLIHKCFVCFIAL